MKTVLTVTNNTKTLKDRLDKFAIRIDSFDEAVSSRKRDGIFYLEEELIDTPIKSMNIINVFICDDYVNPFYDVSVTEEDAMKLFTNIYTAKDLPYCELTKDLFKRQDYDINSCEECYMKCERRLKEFERTPEINTIFQAYCEEMYEKEECDYKKAQIAIANGWPVEKNLNVFKKYALTEEELFEEFIYGDFHDFVLMAPLLKKRVPEMLSYYFKHRQIRLKEMIVFKYTDIFEDE